MKRFLILTVVVLMLFAMVACNSKEPVNNSTNNTQTEETKASTEATQPNEGPFDGLVAVNNAKCAIKITELDPDNINGYTLKVELENKSSDMACTFRVEKSSVNGVQCVPSFTVEVGPGKKANKEITFSDSFLADFTAEEYTDIELTFWVYAVENFDMVDIANETVHVYPFGASKATKFERPTQDSDKVIVDNDKVTVIVTGYENDETAEYSVNLFLVNKLNEEVVFKFDNASINGFTDNAFYATSVSAKNCAFSKIFWSADVLQKNGIESVEEIAFLLRAFGYDDWFDEDDLVNMNVTLNP